MLEAALASGTADRHCVFEVFARRLPSGRRYGVVAGTGRLLEALATYRFDAESLAALDAQGFLEATVLDYLADWRFTGDVRGYAEGECFFAESPILQVEAPFAEAVLLETLVLSILNHDCAVAAAASRMTSAAGRRPCLEMGSRRTHEQAAVAAARAAYVAGFSATSNLAAGQRYGVPTAGTAAHAFTLLHDDERAAFAAQVKSLGRDTTLLVDTFDVDAGVRAAIDVAGLGSRRRATRLGRPGVFGGRGARAARLPGRDRDADRGHQRPRRVRHRRAGRRSRGLLRRRHLGRDGQRRPDGRTGLQARGRRRPLRREAIARQGGPRRQVLGRACAARRRRGRRGGLPRWSPGAERRAPAAARRSRRVRRAGRPPSHSDVARSRHQASLAELPHKALQLQRGESALPTVSSLEEVGS